MVSQFEEMGNVLGDLGLALIAMAKYEDEEGARTGSYTDSSAASKDISADTRRVGMVRIDAPANAPAMPLLNGRPDEQTSVHLSRLACQATAGLTT